VIDVASGRERAAKIDAMLEHPERLDA